MEYMVIFEKVQDCNHQIWFRNNELTQDEEALILRKDILEWLTQEREKYWKMYAQRIYKFTTLTEIVIDFILGRPHNKSTLVWIMVTSNYVNRWNYQGIWFIYAQLYVF